MKKDILLIIVTIIASSLSMNSRLQAQNAITIKNAPLCGQPECAEEAKVKDSLDLALASVSSFIDKSQIINISDNVNKAADKYKVAEESVSFADADTENGHKNAQMLTDTKKETTNQASAHRIKSKAYHIEPLNAMIFIPEKFTPNGDQINDKFYVYGADIKGFTMKIYDTQERLVFESASIDKGWNGKVKGKILYGLYAYVITFPIGSGHIETIKGVVQSVD